MIGKNDMFIKDAEIEKLKKKLEKFEKILAKNQNLNFEISLKNDTIKDLNKLNKKLKEDVKKI